VWVLLNDTPFSADRGCYRDRHGREVWMGGLRASFDVTADGRLKRSEIQTPPRRTAAWTGEPGQSSLLDDSDLVPRGGSDLLIRGHAHAPRGRSVRVLDVGFRLGSRVKTLRVHGERRWVRGSGSEVVPGPAEPFEKVPLVYERAFGGTDPNAPPERLRACAANPVGSGYRYEPAELLDQPAPQIEYPGVALAAGTHQIAPPGFGPIAPHWQPRVSLAGTYDEAWRASRAPLRPADYHPDFVRCAPQDQQKPSFLRGGDWLELSHLTEEGSLRLQLPDIAVRMTTVFRDGAVDSEAHLHIVRALLDERRVELSWIALQPCQGREHEILRARISCKGARPWL
jgi:hypothetical protein